MLSIIYNWREEIWQMHVFAEYLAVVAVLTAIRAIWLLIHLLSRRHGRRSARDISKLILEPEALAAYVLAGGFSHKSLANETEKLCITISESKAALRSLDLADIEFQRIWAMCNTKISKITRLVPVTLLLVALVVTSGFYSTIDGYSSEHSSEYNHHDNAVYFGVTASMDRLSIGFAAAVIFFLISEAFKSMLTKRSIFWRHFVARNKHLLIHREQA
jgi:hypothetical protein